MTTCPRHVLLADPEDGGAELGGRLSLSELGLASRAGGRRPQAHSRDCSALPSGSHPLGSAGFLWQPDVGISAPRPAVSAQVLGGVEGDGPMSITLSSMREL